MSKARKKIAVILGTRPEAIKLAPVIDTFVRDDRFQVIVISTAQHRQMLDQVLQLFRIIPQYDLNIMTDNQSISDVTTACLNGVGAILAAERPDMAIVQGDTTTVFASALASFYQRIPVGHVEAGLRTADKFSPFPEEVNRRLASVLTDIHFAPTEWARDNLLKEGVPAERIVVTGNTVVDALFEVASRDVDCFAAVPGLVEFLDRVGRFVLVTAHRRESFGEPFRGMCRAMKEIVAGNQGLGIIYPVHPNPNVRNIVREILQDDPHVLLLDPLDYITFVHLMKRACLILTDSGGVQEEAPSLGKPVLIMREKTERQEGVTAGVTRLVGTTREGIVSAVNLLLRSDYEYRRMATGRNPFGDGMAAERIVERVAQYFSE
ncbi:non-hydrolyzing UDP-N-acetylglucosamine 2-epimerase [Geobacter benzoatilyticus]|uniref:UDP-N-acetylglucosamine 2-epimerase (non-hydrolyzing) n=1 Tax=Geobacter benzoatilyticus TaxID=2815309 RepID=A0ABX7Q1E2_9BACT|nr:UDP-N-acetylglucosamine 2-epimerase (non-hydrolyzing) [Geobacter benzoatilyticus]QSV45032.1 UDP-N-acetylglucosamine 2-epimerase (non-hydrolyzing) [Geobacter benzoatilyticus]